MGLQDLYEFDLVPTKPDASISTKNWSAIQHRLLELQPARSVSLVGQPPDAIRVLAFGGTDIAPALLADVERLAETRLRVVVRDGAQRQIWREQASHVSLACAHELRTVRCCA